MRQILIHPLALLAALAVATFAFLSAYVMADRTPTAAAELLLTFSWTVMLALWIDADSRHRHRSPCFEFSFLAAVYFPVSLLWYCVWSRGWMRGLLLLLVIFGLWILPRFFAGVFWVVLQLRHMA
jgi:hypothetical protein